MRPADALPRHAGGLLAGALARLLVVLATVPPYPLAAPLAWLLLGVTISPMGIWRVAQRLGEAVAQHTGICD